FWSTYKTYEATYGANYASKVKSDVFYSKARKYESSLHRALDEANVPVEVYHTLLEEANATLPTLHRYCWLRGRMLGVDQPHYYDIYPDLVTLDKDFSLVEGKKIVEACVAPLGADYVAKLSRGINGTWMHAYPQPGKRSGAYMFGAAYDVHPYV